MEASIALPIWVWIVLAIVVGVPLLRFLVGLIMRPFLPGWGEWTQAFGDRFGDDTLDVAARSNRAASTLHGLYRRWRRDRRATNESAAEWLDRHS